MQDQLRAAAWTLRQDLVGVTCPTVPWQRPERDVGYFELIEGPLNDADASTIVADVDDILMFTTQRLDGTFSAQVGNERVESPVAEVVWFCKPQTTQPIAGLELRSIYRRCLLVRPYLATSETLGGSPAYDRIDSTVAPFKDLFPTEISLRSGAATVPATVFYPNGLADLTKRENRFLHSLPVVNGVPAFPFETSLSQLQTSGPLPSGDDVVLSNVLAFDVRVFDPQQSPMTYVDLGQTGNLPPTLLSGTSSLVAAGKSLTVPTYCTWSYHYEFNGLDEDEDAGGWRVRPDQGTNGLDDNDDGVPDDVGELETSPPYNVPLRGIEIRLRCIEPQSLQIRQVTIRHSFSQ